MYDPTIFKRHNTKRIQERKQLVVDKKGVAKSMMGNIAVSISNQ